MDNNASDNSSNKVYVSKIVRRRGRSYTRKEKKRFSLDSRIIRDSLQVSFAQKEFRREMKQFEKTVQEAAGRGIHDIPLPDFLATLKDAAKVAEGNFTVACISKDAMSKYPPLTA